MTSKGQLSLYTYVLYIALTIWGVSVMPGSTQMSLNRTNSLEIQPWTEVVYLGLIYHSINFSAGI